MISLKEALKLDNNGVVELRKELKEKITDEENITKIKTGYSMIVDDIKTIDDAINEATLDMKTDKEEYK